jgi:hypothetical protein
VEWCAVVVACDGRWWFDSQSSPACQVVVGHGGYQWQAAVDCWSGRGERWWWVGVCVVVVLFLPPHPNGVCRFEWWCASSLCWVVVLPL